MALWLKIPALFSSILGPTVGKLLTVTLAAFLLGGAAILAPRVLAPLFVPAPTQTALPTLTLPPTTTQTLTSTAVPTFTTTETATATQTATQTATETPSLTPIPTYAILRGEILNRIACRYGPGDFYLYRFGLIPGNRMEIRGRVDLQMGRQTETWVWGLPEFFPDVCWINARDIKLDGDLSSLEVVYPDKVDLPFLRDPRWPIPQNVQVERHGDEVAISWDFFDVPLGERESANSPRYVLEVWHCQNGQVIFTPLPVYDVTKVTVIDQGGCAEPSHGRIVLAEKHGYVGPVEIPWLPALLPPP
jgi:hypothetical protein